MGIVEVGMMGVRPGRTPLDSTTEDGQILVEAWHTVIRADGGPQSIYWGVSVEDPSRSWAWFDWHSLEEHEAFAKSTGREATKSFGEVFTSGFTKHAYLDTTVLRSPVTEVMLAIFPSNMTQLEQEHISKQFSSFKTKALDKCSDVRGVNAGWGRENDFSLLGEGQTGTAFFALIGWGDIDEHMAFRETPEFKENVDVLRKFERCIKLQMFHVKCSALLRTI